MKDQGVLNLGLQSVPSLELVEDHLVDLCRDYIDAVNLCMLKSRTQRNQEEWARLLGMKRGTLNLILNRGGKTDRRRTLDPTLFPIIQYYAGNKAINQFLNRQLGDMPVPYQANPIPARRVTDWMHIINEDRRSA